MDYVERVAELLDKQKAGVVRLRTGIKQLIKDCDDDMIGSVASVSGGLELLLEGKENGP